MIYNIYSIRDRKANYGSVFVELNDDLAKRGFAMSLRGADSIIGFAPFDFDLYCLGTFDSASGTISSHPHEFVANGADMVNLYKERFEDAIANH